jgi:hypothetical protein
MPGIDRVWQVLLEGTQALTSSDGAEDRPAPRRGRIAKQRGMRRIIIMTGSAVYDRFSWRGRRR